MLAAIFLIIVLVLIIAAIFTYIINPFLEGYRQKSHTKSYKTASNSVKENYLKELGDEFEKFIVTKFDRKFFKIKEWRSDKYVNGIYAESNKNPDLDIEFSHNGKSILFSVECKYRTKIYDEIVVAKPHKIQEYKNYSTQNKVPVFIVLGLGGEPHNPNECYIIPINKLHNETMPYNRLQQYRKHGVNSNFFFNPSILHLS